MFTATLARHARAQAAPRPDHGLDRARRRLPGRDAHPHRHHAPGLRPAVRQGLRAAPTRSSAPRPPTASPKASAPAGVPSPPLSSTQVSKVDGVRTAEGSVTGYALLTDNEGKAVLTSGGAPTMGYSMPADRGPARRRQVLLRHSTRRVRTEVAIDATSAEEHHIALGSTIKVLFHGPTREVHRRRHRRLRRREEPRRHDGGLLRLRHRAAGPRQRPACSTRSTSAPTTACHPGRARAAASTRCCPTEPRR